MGAGVNVDVDVGSGSVAVGTANVEVGIVVTVAAGAGVAIPQETSSIKSRNMLDVTNTRFVFINRMIVVSKHKYNC